MRKETRDVLKLMAANCILVGNVPSLKMPDKKNVANGKSEFKMHTPSSKSLLAAKYMSINRVGTEGV